MNKILVIKHTVVVTIRVPAASENYPNCTTPEEMQAYELGLSEEERIEQVVEAIGYDSPDAIKTEVTIEDGHSYE